MTTARVTAVALLLLGSLAACDSADAGAGSGPAAAPVDLATALTVDMKGLQTAAVAEPPDTVCRDGNYSDDPVPVVPGSLGEPTGVGYASEDAELHAWAWRTATADSAASVVDEAVADLRGCSYQVHFDSDTDGDGEIDAGGSETQTARPWDDGTWTGMAASGQFFGGGAELVESRFVRAGDVVLLVVLTVHGNDEARLDTVDSYLAGVAERLT
jgi:hypothetical protein